MATEAQALLEKLDRISEVEAAQREPLPRMFGPYLLLAALARGGMGEVFLARSGAVAGFEKHCVVKTLRPHLTDDREYVARFIDEARVVVQLGHKNVCQVFDVGMVGERYYLAMELIAGQDLRTLADLFETGETSGPHIAANADGTPIATFDPALAIHVVGEVLEALDYAHRFVDVNGQPLHLVHRDVSPQNVMLSYEGEVKLIDFGLAASTSKMEQTSPNVVMGKLAYMCPEQIRGEKLDGRADLFAAAVMLTELLTGERYYAGKTPYEIWSIASAGTFRPRRFGALDVDLQAILNKALAAAPADRHASCLELREALMRWSHKQGHFADSPRLRSVMQTRFAAEIKAHRELLAGVNSAANLRAPPAPAHEPSRSFARLDASKSGPKAAPSSSSPSSSSSEPHEPTASTKTASPSVRVVTLDRATDGTEALIARQQRGRRLWLGAAAAVAVGVAAVVVAVVGGSNEGAVVDAGVTVAVVEADPVVDPVVDAVVDAGVAVDAAKPDTPKTDKPKPKPDKTRETPKPDARPDARPDVKITATPKPDVRVRTPVAAWDDLGVKQKVDLIARCSKTCAADIAARFPTWAKDKTTEQMRGFRTDLDACGKTCGVR